ncbi:hypothetical protein cand_017840 [Cryptosporidium andersoni]|uniref:Uncharacterized protein n=1 Tax=Cryptosporidium andersoni TaxID=117008 RepID=A0A1J4MHX0_9CRYT|nr:hypothetical protein cand_017840 [Cryptosporidium andersoni]
MGFTIYPRLSLFLLGFLFLSKSDYINSLHVEFICQCYCSISEYDISSGTPKVQSVEFLADVRPIILPVSGSRGVADITNLQSMVKTSSGLIKEYRLGTVAIWNSDFDLSTFSSMDQPNDMISIFNTLPIFDDIFLKVNKLSSSYLNSGSKPAIIFLKDYIDDETKIDNLEYNPKYQKKCQKLCERPNSTIQPLSYSKVEYVELTHGGRIFDQYPAKNKYLYSNLNLAIKDNLDFGKCNPSYLETKGIPTNWIDIYNNLRLEFARKQADEEFARIYPILSIPVQKPLIVEFTESARNSFEESAYSRLITFQRYMLSSGVKPISGFPNNIADFFEQQISPLFQFRAVLKAEDSRWIVKEIYKGNPGDYGFSAEFLNIFLKEEEILSIESRQSDILESWANSFWTIDGTNKYTEPADLPIIQDVERYSDENKLESWLRAKEKQIREFEGDIPVSLLQIFKGFKTISNTQIPIAISGQFVVINEDNENKKQEKIPIKGVEEIHIVYYGMLTLNCFTSINLNENSDFQFNNKIVFATFPDKVFLRTDVLNIKEVNIPNEIKRWHTIELTTEASNGIDLILTSSTHQFAQLLAKINPSIYLALFRDLKHMFMISNESTFMKNVCTIPTNKSLVELVYEDEESLIRSPAKLFNINSFGHISLGYVKFSDSDYFNYLTTLFSKCFGVVPPNSRIRIKEEFQRKIFTSDLVCAIDDDIQNYQLQVYSRINY